MGQGLFQAIGFGVLDDGFIPREEDDDTEQAYWFDELMSRIEREHEVRIKQVYEADKPYIAVVAAVSDGVLAEWWHAAELPTRFAVSIDGLADRLRPDLDRARAAWAALQAEARKEGVTVPDGEVIYFSDWD